MFIITSDHLTTTKIIAALLFFICFIFTIAFATSNFMCNQHMKAYEKGEIQKEYTIIETDTTYKWIYK